MVELKFSTPYSFLQYINSIILFMRGLQLRWLEHRSDKAGVGSSNLPRPTTIIFFGLYLSWESTSLARRGSQVQSLSAPQDFQFFCFLKQLVFVVLIRIHEHSYQNKIVLVRIITIILIKTLSINKNTLICKLCNKGFNQVNKGVRRMPWHLKAMKDVVSCDKPRLGANNH